MDVITSACPCAGEGSAVAADVADQIHLHAEGAEHAEGGNQCGDADEGAVLAAAEGAPMRTK